MAGKRKKYDWEAIEREYRMGQKSLRTLSDEFGPTPAGISKHAKTHGWIQDKTKEVREKTQAALLTEQVDKDVNSPTQEDIERAVRSNVQVIKSHRKSIGKSQALVDLLSSQLEDAATNRDEFETQIDGECVKADGGINYQKRNRLRKALSLPSHAAVLRDLSTAQKNLIALERQAFNLNETDDTHNDLSELLKEIAGATRGIGNNRKIQK